MRKTTFELKGANNVEGSDEELSLNELEQVAGGTTNMANGQYCSSDYDPNDWCWADDRCLSSWNFYRAKGYCKSTMEENESCWNVGHCNAGIEQYSKCYQNELLY